MVFDDSRWQRSNELSFLADKALAAGERERAEALYAEAAKLEGELALSITDGRLRIRSVLAISALALWLKARNAVEFKKLALVLLTGPLTEQGRADVLALVERCKLELQ